MRRGRMLPATAHGAGPSGDGQAFFRRLVEDVPIGIYQTTPEGRVLYANPALLHMLGYASFEELARRNLEADEYEPSYPRREYRERLERDGVVRGLEASWRRSDGTTIYVRENARAIRDREGHVRYYEGTVEDVTARRRTEEALERWAHLFQHMSLGVVVGDAEGRILEFMNPAFARMHGWTVEELTGRPILDVFAPEVRDEVPDHIRKAHERGTYSFESLHLRRDGSVFPVLVNVSTVHDERGEVAYRVASVQDITELKEIQDALRRSEERLRTVVSAAPVALVSVDARGVFTLAEGKGLEVLGLMPEQILARSLAELGAEAAGVGRHLVRALAGEAGSELTVVGDHAFDIHYAPIRNADGTIAGAIGVATDVTERRRAELARRESEEKYRIITENTTDLVSVTDAEGRYLYASPSFRRVLGYDPREVVGQSPFDLIHPDDLPRATEGWKHLLATGSSEAIVRLRAVDGSWRWIEARGSVARGNGKPLVVAAGRDVTERKRVELRRTTQYAVARILSESTTMGHALAELLRALGQGLGWQVALYWGRNASDQLEFVTAWQERPGAADEFVQASKALRYREGEAAPGQVWNNGRPLWFSDVASSPQFLRTEAAARSGLHSGLGFPVVAGDHVVGVIELYTRDKVPPEEDLLELMRSVGFQVGLAIERRSAEAEIRRLNAELENRIQRRTAQLQAANDELEAFSYSVSHDLRTPLRTIDGFSQALLEEYEKQLNPEGQDLLRRIRAATRRMGGLIDDLLTLSQVTRKEFHREKVDLSELARQTSQTLKDTPGHAPVEFVIQDGVTATGDQGLLRLVLENLLQNAHKFTKRARGARIEFGVEHGKGPPVYFVRDNGAGFDPAHAHKLFQPFQRLHSTAEFEGTGIGLATVHRVILRHGGRVWAEGEVGRGAAFRFTLQPP